MLRIGCVKYLNARPLIRGWPGDVDFDHPSPLCQRLANAELDVALVSSFEFLRNPIYRIVDGVSISSHGPVYSVVVAHRGEISDIEEIELDPGSQTAVNLLRCLLAELKLRPRFIRNIDLQSVFPAALQPSALETSANISAGRAGNMSMFPATTRARLLIGDQAIRFRHNYSDGFHFWDLGEAWKKLIGVPFVYALWLIRPEFIDAQKIADRLRRLRDANLTNLENLIAETVAGIDDRGAQHTTREFLGRYYRENLRFRFGDQEQQGLRAFARLCVKHGLLPELNLDLETV
jgi:chorismate dehydratase